MDKSCFQPITQLKYKTPTLYKRLTLFIIHLLNIESVKYIVIIYYMFNITMIFFLLKMYFLNLTIIRYSYIILYELPTLKCSEWLIQSYHF